jgi:hypothetical protein
MTIFKTLVCLRVVLMIHNVAKQKVGYYLPMFCYNGSAVFIFAALIPGASSVPFKLRSKTRQNFRNLNLVGKQIGFIKSGSYWRKKY